MDVDKVKAISKWAIPKSVTKAKRSYGLARFYRKLIQKFSGINAPLIDCLKEKSLKWNQGPQENFELLKKKVTEALVLALHDFNKFFQLDCDASGVVIGVVLSQEGRPIAYFSEKLNNTRRNY